MNKGFFKKNWVYIALFFSIVLLNLIPQLAGEKTQKKAAIEKEALLEEENPEFFVDFEEAKSRSAKMENALKGNLPLYLFYISLNLSIIFLFLLGLTVDGYFLFKRSKGVSLLQRSPRSPPAWQIGDIFKILILGITASYIFFIVFGAVVGFFESFTKTKFEFYKAENFRMIFDTIILDVAIFLVILGFLRKVYGKKLSSLGFAKKGMARNIFYGAAGYAGIIPIVIIIGIFVYIILNLLRIKPPPQPIVGFFLAEKNVALIFISGAIAAIIGPVIEEIFFRGIMYNAVKKKLGVFRSILITSVLFSFLHTHAASFFLVGFVPIAILGAALAYLYEKTGSLIPSITLHVLNNVGSVITVFAFRYFNNLVQ